MQTTTTQTATHTTAKAIRALGVIIKTPHIATYLAQYDPKALAQAKEAFYSFSDGESPLRRRS
jgi:TnpA family transposase